MKIRVCTFALMFLSCNYLTKPSVNKECNYIVPSEWKLSQNKAGKWAIINSDGDLLGWSIRYSNYWFYSYDSNEAMVFDDSCSAKGLAKQYADYIDKNKFK